MTAIKTKANKRLKVSRTFSAATLERFNIITQEIKACEKGIIWLNAIAKGEIDLRKTASTPAVRRYQRTPEDEARLPKTLESLARRIYLLNYEREVLKRYGC